MCYYALGDDATAVSEKKKQSYNAQIDKKFKTFEK